MSELLAMPARLLEADRTFKSRSLDKGAVFEALVLGPDADGAMRHAKLVLILDFGSQYTQLIARRVRELGVFCEVLPFHAGIDAVARCRSPRRSSCPGDPTPSTTTARPRSAARSSSSGPRAGDLLRDAAHDGRVGRRRAPGAGPRVRARDRARQRSRRAGSSQGWARSRECGRATATTSRRRLPASARSRPPGTRRTPRSRTTAAKLYAVQFHPEVDSHRARAGRALKNFLFGICGCRGDWTIASFVEEAVADVRRAVGDGRVVCALSGRRRFRRDGALS